jgi:hypothetical protein
VLPALALVTHVISLSLQSTTCFITVVLTFWVFLAILLEIELVVVDKSTFRVVLCLLVLIVCTTRALPAMVDFILDFVVKLDVQLLADVSYHISNDSLFSFLHLVVIIQII